MRRLLNLNEAGSRAAVLIGILLIVVPAFLIVGSLLLGLVASPNETALELIPVSIIIGLTLLAGLLVLVMAEVAQDRYIDAHYLRERNRKVQISNVLYECQYCGNRQVRVDDTYCPVCGQDLLDELG